MDASPRLGTTSLIPPQPTFTFGARSMYISSMNIKATSRNNITTYAHMPPIHSHLNASLSPANSRMVTSSSPDLLSSHHLPQPPPTKPLNAALCIMVLTALHHFQLLLTRPYGMVKPSLPLMDQQSNMIWLHMHGLNKIYDK